MTHDKHVREVQALFIKRQPAIRAMAIALTGDFTLAEDVVQETFLTVSEKAATFTLGTNFSAWVAAITRNKVLTALQQRGRLPKLSTAAIESLAASLPPDNVDERLAALLACLDKLPPKARDLIRMRYHAEHGPQEIASMLNRSVAGVNAGLVKARDLLRDCTRRRLAAEEIAHA